jgi:hypothetical protein
MSAAAGPGAGDLLILTAVFNDWESLSLLLRKLDEVLRGSRLSAEVLAVDDGSSLPFDTSGFDLRPFSAIRKVSILELTRNLGNQRAVAVGLAYVHANIACRAVVLMDADGEDDPRDVPRLIEKYEETGRGKLVFARRVKRNDGNLFKLFYALYKRLYKLLTGHALRVGNFSLIPAELLRQLVCVSEVWSHYPAGVMKSRVPVTEIPADRAMRLAGKSHMNFPALVVHGLTAISIYGDVVGVRLLISTVVLMLAAILGVFVTFAIRLTTTLAIPGWATYVSASLLVIALQALVLSLFFVFIILNSRNSTSLLPARDYLPFVFRLRTIYPGS